MLIEGFGMSQKFLYNMTSQREKQIIGDRKEKIGLKTRADQNTGGALLEFSMRAAMHGKSRVSSAISVCHNQQNFKSLSHLWQ